jgi:predicted MFS family arabinose efflux permease
MKIPYNRKAIMPSAHKLQQWFRREVKDVGDRAVRAAGGGARLKVIILLACVLGLDSADKVTIGAIAVELKHALDIGNMDIGLLVTVSTGIGALATLPMGVLTDRIHRVHLLAASIVLWSVVMAISGTANSYLMLLLTRLALGFVLAAATPVIASLTGDYFDPGVRGKMWGYILSGELVGAGFGILISGEVATLWTWRGAFWVLALVSLILAVIIWKYLPEPVRGTQGHLSQDREDIPSTGELQEGQEEQDQSKGEDDDDEGVVEEKVEEEGIEPHESLILKENPTGKSLWQAVRYILSIRTNVLLIIASACGYFFFTGVRTFAVVYLHNRFDLSQGISKLLFVVIGVGAVVGVLITGRLADRLIKRNNYISARIVVSGAAFLFTAVLFLAGFYMASIYIAVPLFFLASAGLGGANPPVDAARLDIMHSRLWGRAESVRTALRYSFEAIAPIVFSFVAGLFGGNSGLYGNNAENALAMAHTFKIMLIPVIAAGLIMLWARKSYPRDVATALASEEATED